MSSRSRTIVTLAAVFVGLIASAFSGPPEPLGAPDLLKLDNSIVISGGELKVEQTKEGGIRIIGTNDREGTVLYFRKALLSPQAVGSLELEILGVEKPVLAIVRDDTGSSGHTAFRPGFGDDLLEIPPLRFTRNGQDVEYSGKVDKIALTLTKPVGEFVIEITKMRLLP